jgi:hypothetical protein
MTFTVMCQGTITDEGDKLLPPATLGELLDELMSQMEKLEGVQDADIDATLATGRVRLSVDVVNPSADEAFALGRARIRAALHAAMIATPRWEDQETAELAHRRGLIEPDQITLRPHRQLTTA